MADFIIPKTEKTFVRSGSVQLYQATHNNTSNASSTHTIQNPNNYTIELVVCLQAGSGDTNTATYESGEQYWDKNRYNKYRYTYAGRVGCSLTLSYEGVLLAAAGGGGGTPSYQIAQYQGYRYKDSGDDRSHTIRDWWYNGNQNKHLRQEGECVVFLLSLKPKGSATIRINYNSANNAPFKGSFCISGYY